MTRTSLGRQRHTQGFALAAILWLLAGLTILVASIGSSLMLSARTQRDTRERLNLLLDEQRVLADVAYLTLTHRNLGGGMQVDDRELHVDGSTRYLAGDGRVEVHLQDVQGLIGLNNVSAATLLRLLPLCGVPVEAADALGDALLDYTDADSLKRVRGAEAFDYSAAGQRPPRNQPLADARELWQVLGWQPYQVAWAEHGCDEAVSLAGAGQINLWTAPVPVLQAVGMGAEQALAAVQNRDQYHGRHILSDYLLAWRAANDGVGMGQSRFSVRSQGQVRVTVAREGAALARRVVLARPTLQSQQPFARVAAQWLNLPLAGQAPRFTDNLADFFPNPKNKGDAPDVQTSTDLSGRR